MFMVQGCALDMQGQVRSLSEHEDVALEIKYYLLFFAFHSHALVVSIFFLYLCVMR